MTDKVLKYLAGFSNPSISFGDGTEPFEEPVDSDPSNSKET